MKFILLYVALNTNPTMLGSYDSINSCKNAIRTIYLSQVFKNMQHSDVANQLTDTWLQHQQEYVCVAKK
jgi:hypothetical protein